MRAGLQRTRGQAGFLRREDGVLLIYPDNPPLYPLLVAAAYRSSGRSDPLTTRLVPALFHLFGFAGLYVLGRTLFPDRRAVATLALWIAAIVPMSAFFGKLPFNEPVGLAWVVWALVATARYRLRPARATLALAAALWFLACLSSWAPAVILACLIALFVLESAREGRPHALRAAAAFGATLIVAGALVSAQILWANAGRPLSILRAANQWGIHSLGFQAAVRNLGIAIDFHRNYFANVPFLLFIVWLVVRLGDLARRKALPGPSRLLLAGSLGCAIWAVLFLQQVAVHAYGQFWYLPFECLAAADVALAGWERLRARPRARAVIAALAIAGTVASSAVFLHYRYSRRHGYAVRAAEGFARDFYTTP